MTGVAASEAMSVNESAGRIQPAAAILKPLLSAHPCTAAVKDTESPSAVESRLMMTPGTEEPHDARLWPGRAAGP